MKSIEEEIRSIIREKGISLYRIAKDLGISWESLYRSIGFLIMLFYIYRENDLNTKLEKGLFPKDVPKILRDNPMTILN